ncbi:hypothetical protein AAY473_025929, partial [Plecturocebus cupreus]
MVVPACNSSYPGGCGYRIRFPGSSPLPSPSTFCSVMTQASESFFRLVLEGMAHSNTSNRMDSIASRTPGGAPGVAGVRSKGPCSCRTGRQFGTYQRLLSPYSELTRITSLLKHSGLKCRSSGNRGQSGPGPCCSLKPQDMVSCIPAVPAPPMAQRARDISQAASPEGTSCKPHGFQVVLSLWVHRGQELRLGSLHLDVRRCMEMPECPGRRWLQGQRLHGERLLVQYGGEMWAWCHHTKFPLGNCLVE